MCGIIIVGEEGGVCMRLETLPWRSEKGEIVAQLCYILICKTENVLTELCSKFPYFILF